MFSWHIILSVIFLALQSPVSQSSSNECTSRECQELSDEITTAMNDKINPCDNFYEFACGQWSSSNPRPNFLGKKWNNMALLNFLTRSRLREELQSPPSSADIGPINQMKEYFKSCMDTKDRDGDSFRYLELTFLRTGGVPMFEELNSWRPRMTWQQLDNHFFPSFGYSMFYKLNLIQETASSTVLSLTIRPQSTFIDMGISRTAYEALIKNVAAAVKQYMPGIRLSQLQNDINDLIAFETQLHSAYISANSKATIVDLTEFIREWNSRTEQYPRGRIDWETLFEKIFAITNLKPSRVNPVTIESFQYFVELARIAQSTSQRTMINYVQWKFLANILPHTNAKMAELFSFQNQDGAAADRVPNWMYCVEQFATNYASYSLYAKKYYQQNSRINANNLYNYLLNRWENKAETSNRLSRGEKNDVKQVVSSLNPVLGHSTFYDNDQNIVNYFGEMTTSDRYYPNIFWYKAHMWNSEIKLWGKPISSKEKLNDPLSVEARLEGNSLIVPVGLLQSPLVDGTLPNYITYSTVGYIISRQMKEAVSNKVFEAIATGSSYEGILDCFINDWTALQIAFDAYQKMKGDRIPNGEVKLPQLTKYSNEEMFFISYAQEFCGKLDDDQKISQTHNYSRLNRLVSNVKGFSAAFKCSRNVQPVDKCHT